MIVNLNVPTTWENLSDKQLLMVYRLFARDLSASEVKTICLLKWTGLHIIGEQSKQQYLVKKGRNKFLLSTKQIQQATTALDFLDDVPAVPVRLKKIGRHRPLSADFEKVPFEKYLFLENLFQGYLNTQQEELLTQMGQILYDSDQLKPDAAERICIFYWFAALKRYLASLFPNFLTTSTATSGNQMGADLFTVLRDATNAQIRALTGGDITKEATIRQMDTHRALTELDAKAREAEEYRKSLKRM